jgi:hypothetical protein
VRHFADWRNVGFGVVVLAGSGRPAWGGLWARESWFLYGLRWVEVGFSGGFGGAQVWFRASEVGWKYGFSCLERRRNVVLMVGMGWL